MGELSCENPRIYENGIGGMIMRWRIFDNEPPKPYDKCFVKYVWSFQPPKIYDYQVLIYTENDGSWDCVEFWMPIDEVLEAIEGKA